MSNIIPFIITNTLPCILSSSSKKIFVKYGFDQINNEDKIWIFTKMRHNKKLKYRTSYYYNHSFYLYINELSDFDNIEYLSSKLKSFLLDINNFVMKKNKLIKDVMFNDTKNDEYNINNSCDYDENFNLPL